MRKQEYTILDNYELEALIEKHYDKVVEVITYVNDGYVDAGGLDDIDEYEQKEWDEFIIDSEGNDLPYITALKILIKDGHLEKGQYLIYTDV